MKFLPQTIPDILLIEPIIHNDKEVSIDWRFLEKEIILSKADQNYSGLSDNKKLF